MDARVALLLAATMLAPWSACTLGSSGVETGPGDEGSSTGPQDSVDGKLSSNGLALVPVMMDRLSTRSLATDRDGTAIFSEEHFPGLLDLPATGADGNGSGLEFVHYLAVCALAPGQSLRIEREDTEIEGLMGLAPDWLYGDCDIACQRWMTACILAHTNNATESVTISLRGAHKGMSWTHEHEADFPYQEAGYYGNMFQGAQRGLYVCAGAGSLDEFESGDIFSLDSIQAAFTERVCASGIGCDIELTGLCSGSVEFPVVGDLDFTACTDTVERGPYFIGCSISEMMVDPFATASVPVHDEVITVYTPDR